MALVNQWARAALLDANLALGGAEFASVVDLSAGHALFATTAQVADVERGRRAELVHVEFFEDLNATDDPLAFERPTITTGHHPRPSSSLIAQWQAQDSLSTIFSDICYLAKKTRVRTGLSG